MKVKKKTEQKPKTQIKVQQKTNKCRKVQICAKKQAKN